MNVMKCNVDFSLSQFDPLDILKSFVLILKKKHIYGAYQLNWDFRIYF